VSEHYRTAEKMLLDANVNPRDRATPGWYTRDELIAAAQVHAMLGLIDTIRELVKEASDD